MNKTLKEYLSIADDYHSHLLSLPNANDLSVRGTLRKHVDNLHNIIRNIQGVAKRIADISNIINKYVKNNNNQVNPYPTPTYHGVLRLKDTFKCTFANEAEDSPENTKLPCKTVENIAEIPVSDLYFVKNTNEYAINLCGIVIKGNLANIVDKSDANKTLRCKYKTKCKSILNNKECKYYHPPEDYIKLNMPARDIRNFAMGSWLHSNNYKLISSAVNMRLSNKRLVGNRKTLSMDIIRLKDANIYDNEVLLRHDQLIHDILVYLILIKNS